MLNSCPNESSQEWKDILKEANGNRERAIELWNERGLADDEKLNEETKAEKTSEPLDPDEEKDNTFSKLIGNIKVFVKKQLAILEQKVVRDQETKEKKLQEFIKTIEAAEGVDSIYLFIKEAYDNANKAEKQLADLIAEKDTADRKIVMARMLAIADFANGYSILDEITNADLKEYFTQRVSKNIPVDKLTPQQLLSDAIATRNRIKSQYVNQGIPLMADFLLGYKTELSAQTLDQIETYKTRLKNLPFEKISDEQKKERALGYQAKIDQLQSFSLDKENLVALLRQANSDTGVLSFLMDPLISSEDAALGLFAKAVKSQLRGARLKDEQNLEFLAKAFDKYRDTLSANRDNPAEFNKGIYKEVTVSYKTKTGETKTATRIDFVEKYDYEKFKKARKEFFSSLGEKPADTDTIKLKEYKAKIAAWNRENKEPKPQSEINEMIAAKKRLKDANLITEEEYKKWEKSVMYKDKRGNITYKGELTQPAKKYISKDWSDMYDQFDKPKNAKGEYHAALLKVYFDAQSKIPGSKRRGFRVPSVPKSDLERAIANGLVNTTKQNISDAFEIKPYDTQFGLAGLGETEAKFLPVHYTQAMNANDVSLDLVRSVLTFASMANRYEAINEIMPEISMFQSIIGSRKIAETNSEGKPILDAFANKQGYIEYIKQNGEAYSKKHVDAFIDMVVYGEMQKAEEILGLSLSKLTSIGTGISAYTTLALDGLKSMANNLQGNIQLIIEANSGEFFNKTNLAIGKAYYAKSMPGLLSDFGKSYPASFLGKLINKYDPMQGKYKDQYGKNVTGSVAAKLFRTDTLFFGLQFGEHEIQVSCMLALMDATIVTTNDGTKMTLLKAYEKFGIDGVEKNTDFTDKQSEALENRLHALSKRMHGIYNDFDKSTSERYSLGRLATMYRKHLVPGYMRRFKSLSMDQELGSITEGFYRTFWNTFIRDMRDYKFNIIQNWSTYSAFEKAQIKRVIAELTIIITATALIAILTALVDDDDEEMKKNYAYNFTLYELIRMRSETASYISPPDAYRVVKSPSAMTSTLERAIKFTDQFFLTWDPEKLEFERKSGVWNAGDNKSWAYFLKLMGYSGYNFTPGEAVESFKGTLNSN